MLAKVESFTGISSYAFTFTLVFAVGLSVPVALLGLASQIAARGNVETARTNFARFGYALIPLDIAGHIAHNLFHLLAEGASVLYTTAAVFGYDSVGDPALMSEGSIRVLQFVVVGLGLAASLHTARRIAQRRYRSPARRRATLLPYTTLIVGLGVLSIVLFLFPMAHRM